ncbi:hypothetical protein RB195_003221 [Necator americanus]|uniref:Uncharacterized protein n=1 Tax=Necator americanus TaxID=51031 RepID=A0ABR1DNC5_NECAM
MLQLKNLHVTVIVNSVVMLTPTEARFSCDPPEAKKPPKDSFKCVEFSWNPSKGNDEFCNSLTNARHGYIRFADKKMMSNCTATNQGNWMCYCSPADADCKSKEWIQKFVSTVSQCWEDWYRSLTYHTTGSSHWIKFVNTNPTEMKDVKTPYLESAFKPLDFYPTPSIIFNPNRQGMIYNVSSLLLVLICFFVLTYATVTIAWCILATKEMLKTVA